MSLQAALIGRTWGEIASAGMSAEIIFTVA
jgi:hypothetical protein